MKGCEIENTHPSPKGQRWIRFTSTQMVTLNPSGFGGQIIVDWPASSAPIIHLAPGAFSFTSNQESLYGVPTPEAFLEWESAPDCAPMQGGGGTVPIASLYQTNRPGAFLDFDGSTSGGCDPAASMAPVGTDATLNLGTVNAGMGWELLIGFMPLAPNGGGASLTANGQIINVQLSDPNLIYLNDRTFPPFRSSPMAMPFTVAHTVISMQMMVMDPTHPDGISFSQACELNATH